MADLTMALVMKNVSYSVRPEKRHKKKIISNVNITLKKGEFVSLIGKSGTGKSTILKLCAGLLKPDEGEIRVYGKATEPGSVGYMPQKDLLLPWRTVLENIMLASEFQKGAKVTKNEARNWLKRVGLKDYENALPRELSGGMRQRAAFLRTILTEKEVLLLDEPFGALDALTKKEMHSWLLSIWEELNKTILFITHDLEEAILLSDRIILLHLDQTTEEIPVDLPRPRHSEMVHTMDMVNYKKMIEKKIADG